MYPEHGYKYKYYNIFSGLEEYNSMGNGRRTEGHTPQIRVSSTILNDKNCRQKAGIYLRQHNLGRKGTFKLLQIV